VIVLAGDRGPDDPLCRAAGVPAKALVPVAGRAVLLRVLDAVEACAGASRTLCGPAQDALAGAANVQARLDAGGWHWLAPAASPARSVLAALEHAGLDAPVLLTTADHALLTPEVLDTFWRAALDLHSAGDADVAVGFVPLALVGERFPGVRRTALRFRDGAFCTCNLFALLTPASASVVAFWRRVEAERKHPWRIARMIGLATLAGYVTRRLTLAGALDRIGRRTGTRIRPVVLPVAEAAVDVDSVADWELANAVLAGRA
jgi:GTP:adenosylcobinamide-phosphate guanylyltransferase